MSPAAAPPPEPKEKSMTDPLAPALGRFADAIAGATNADAALAALHDLARALGPARLFTVTLSDMAAGLARRAYSSDAAAYPVSGTKPINRNGFFHRVHVERRTYVNNDITTDREHFTDHELIARLGCGAAFNMPVVLGGVVRGTVNILDATDSFPPETVARIEAGLRIPAMLAFAVATRPDAQG